MPATDRLSTFVEPRPAGPLELALRTTLADARRETDRAMRDARRDHPNAAAAAQRYCAAIAQERQAYELMIEAVRAGL